MIIQERIPVSSTLTPDARVVLRQTPIAPDISIDNLAEDDPLRQIWSEFDPEQRVCINIIKNAGDTGIDRTGIEILMADNAVHRVNPVLDILRAIRTRISDNSAVSSKVRLETFFVKTERGRQARVRFVYPHQEQDVQEHTPPQEVVCPNGATEVANAPITVVDPKPPTVVTPDNPYGLTDEELILHRLLAPYTEDNQIDFEELARMIYVGDIPTEQRDISLSVLLYRYGEKLRSSGSSLAPHMTATTATEKAKCYLGPSTRNLQEIYPEPQSTAEAPSCNVDDLAKAGYHQKQNPPEQTPIPQIIYPDQPAEVVSPPLTVVYPETAYPETETQNIPAPVQQSSPIHRLGKLDARHKATRTTTARVVVKHPTTKPPVTTQSEGKGQPRSSQVVAPRPGLVFHGTEWLSLRAKKTVPAEPTTLSTTQKPDFLARLTPLEKAVFSQFESLDDTKVQTISESDLARAACGPYATMQTAIASLNNALRSLERKLFDENLLLIKAHGKQGYSYSLIPRPPDGQGVLFKKKSA